MSQFGDNLRAAIDAHPKFQTYKEVADKLGISPTTLNSYMIGRTQPSLEFAQDIANIVGLSLTSLIGSNREWFTIDGFKYAIANGMVQLPTVGLAAAGEWQDPSAMDDFEYVDADMVVKRNQFCFRADGDSMFDFIYPNDLCVACVWANGGRSGHIAIVRDEDNKMTVKQFRSSSNGAMLIPYNQNYAPQPFRGELIGFVMGYIRLNGDGTRQTLFNPNGLIPRNR
jgi:SOS-response transcriptional repressor LexA